MTKPSLPSPPPSSKAVPVPHHVFPHPTPSPQGAGRNFTWKSEESLLEELGYFQFYSVNILPHWETAVWKFTNSPKITTLPQ